MMNKYLKNALIYLIVSFLLLINATMINNYNSIYLLTHYLGLIFLIIAIIYVFLHVYLQLKNMYQYLKKFSKEDKKIV